LESIVPPTDLSGLSILVVEDEAIIALMIEDMLSLLGCTSVLHASAVAPALVLLAEEKPNAALLDVNLGGEPAYAIAERLEALQIPFIFASGYGSVGLPPRWSQRPVIQKPFTPEMLAAKLLSLLRG